ncbi:hypothetical protein VIGAN_03125300 [Vigna angularis var. angularis]|uniref:Uncharacterized protein n=1 Tax=Vigna angularis var. angularis TaxID=157739 RepID=A0A0S3RLQ7_PHAAN|nr:hypothetical protein VIGAN_03125300 [Vigna angularis var. angularis]
MTVQLRRHSIGPDIGAWLNNYGGTLLDAIGRNIGVLVYNYGNLLPRTIKFCMITILQKKEQGKLKLLTKQHLCNSVLNSITLNDLL